MKHTLHLSAMHFLCNYLQINIQGYEYLMLEDQMRHNIIFVRIIHEEPIV